jgi:tetratricopeptide (TPR) repeat protein
MVLGPFVAGCQTTTTREYDDYTGPQQNAQSYLDTRLKKLEEKASEYPKVPDYRYQIAGVHFERGDYTDAVTHLREAIYLDPNQSRYRFHLGRCYLQMKEMELAEEEFRAAVRLSAEGRFSGPYASLGYVLALRGKHVEAKENLHRAIEIDPEDPEPHYFLGALYDLEKDRDQAVYHLREYLDRGGRQYRKRAVFVLEKLGVKVDLEKLKPAAAPADEAAAPEIDRS